jgi:SSS family transporter
MNVGFWNYLVIVAYLIGVIVIGMYFSRNEKTSEDYLLGGRNMPWWAVGISFVMSLLSTYSIVMVPGEIFNHGLSMWVVGGLLGPFMMIIAFSIFIRFYFRLQSFTPFEYLEKRYDKKVRILIAVIFVWTRLIYLGMVLFATSKVFEGGFGWPSWITILVVGVIGIIYTICGGLKAVIWTDVMQFVVLAAGLIAAVTVLCLNIDGGAVGAVKYAFDQGHGLSLFSEKSFYEFNPYIRLCVWILLLDSIVAPLYYCSADQISIQRLLSTKNYKEAKKSILINPFLTLPFTFSLWFIGLAIFTYYHQNPSPMVKSGDTAFFTFISTKLPTPFPGVILAAMLAAAMSTLDSGLNSLSTIWIKEFHIPFINRQASEQKQVRLSRFATLYIGIFATVLGIMIAMFSETFKQSVVEAATIFEALAVVILPAYLLAVFSKKASSKIIWNMAFLCWGINFGGVAWYMVSKANTGITGAIPITFPLVPFIISIVLWAAFALFKKYRIISAIAHFSALTAFGFSIMLCFWFVMSNYGSGGELSFKWVGLPGFATFLVVGFLWTALFGKKQPPEKYEGLTLWSSASSNDLP